MAGKGTEQAVEADVAAARMGRGPAGSGAPGAAREKVGGLVLARHLGQSIVIGGNVEVEVVGIRSATVRLRIVAPREVPVHRLEVYRAIRADGGPVSPTPSAGRPEGPPADRSRPGQGGLVLTRHLGESVMIGDDVEVEVVEVRPGGIRLRIAAPREVPVHRLEVHEAIHAGH